MNRLAWTVLLSGACLLVACGSSSSEPVAADGGDRNVSPSVDAGAADSGARGPTEAGTDAGGRVANFDFGAVCTASWLAHDLARPIRFAVELKRGTLPNNTPSVTIWFTPLRATAQVVESKATVGSTLLVPEEFVGGYDFFDAALDSPNDQLVVPAEATAGGESVELSGAAVYGYVPPSGISCGWIAGALTKPTQDAKAQLRCLFYPSGGSARPNAWGSHPPAPTAEDFQASACANSTFQW